MSTHLERSLVGLTIEASEHALAWEKAVSQLSAQNMIQQLQIPIRGVVGRTPQKITGTVNFPYPLMIEVAPGATESDLSYPHFAFGVQMLTRGNYVSVDPQILGFITNDRGFTKQAELQVVAYCPNAPRATSFSAILHMTISGYATPLEGDSEG